MSHKPLIYDEWLARILQRDVYRLTIDDDLTRQAGDRANGLHDLLQGLQARPVFLYTKTSVEALTTVRLLETAGFNLVDTNVVFEKAIGPEGKAASGCTLRFAVAADEQPVAELARKNFIYSRFHRDNAIPRETANTVKAEWARNYFLGQRGQQMVVAVLDETIVGFLQLLYAADKTLVIDLVAVADSQRRRGIAGDMIAYAEAECGDFARIRVGTQVANVPSIRLYEKMGFRLTDAQYVFHYHHLP